MGVAQKLIGVGMGFGWLTLLIASLAMGIGLLFGLTWISVTVFPWLMPTFFWTLAVCLLVLGPTALFRRTRGFSAAGLLVASFVFGAILWMWSLLLTLGLWGVVAVLIGLFLMGIGIVPVAILAAIFHARWLNLADIMVMLTATFGARGLAFWLVAKATR